MIYQQDDDISLFNCRFNREELNFVRQLLWKFLNMRLNRYDLPDITVNQLGHNLNSWAFAEVVNISFKG